MARVLASPIYGAVRSYVTGISSGGTGATSASEALASLGALAKSLKNAINGYVALNSNSKVPAEFLNVTAVVPTVVGATSSVVNQTTTHVISNYDIGTNYTLSAVRGTVSRSGNTITYTAPSTAGSGGFILNGTTFGISVIQPTVQQPSVISPVAGSNTHGSEITFTSSSFIVNGGSDSHASSNWQLATDAGFSNIVAQVSNSGTNKTTWTVTGLVANTTYYVRVQHIGNSYGNSSWSNGISLSTKTSFYVQGNEQAKLLASDAASSDYFGWSVSIANDGNTAIVGAHYKAGSASGQGAAYVFTRAGSSWTQQAKLLASDPASSDNFGGSVSIASDGNTAIVGAYLKTGTAGSRQGAAYVFTRAGSSWTQQAKLLASDPASSDYFGISVSIASDGNTAIVGANLKTGYQGAAYVFTRAGSSWTQQAKLLASDPASGDRFGTSVSIASDGNTAIVGAYYKTGSAGNYQGAAYVFTRAGSSWTQQTKLLASDAASGDYFGWSVSIASDGNTAIVGAYYKAGSAGIDQGAAYVFTRAGSSWTQQAKLLASDPAIGDRFGWSVSIASDGNTAIVGANYKVGSAGAQQGAAYVFTRAGSSWTQQAKLLASDPASNDNFGYSVNIASDGNTAIVGAYYKAGSAGIGQGAAYMFV